ncbi:MAG: enoyl-CoA hydratase/isomerase family protein [Rhizobiaceae bacterium]|nr:enoyl-CoA hydratase/isomerase family protein [Rhizobiaceae bacterium]
MENAAPYQSYAALRIERRGRILTITLDSPPTNMSLEIHRELSTIFADVNRDADTAVVIFTGADKVFSAGGNINRMAERAEKGLHADWLGSLEEAKETLLGLLRCKKPVIARVNGHAMGMGATLATFCDISVMVETAKIADTHVKVGLAAGDGGALLWPTLIGYARARELLLLGETITGAQAAQYGLITRAVPASELDATVNRFAEALASGATAAINGTKIAINAVLRAQLEPFIETHFGIETATYLSADHREAATAFRDKRQPAFTGR